jgi:iron complex transport system permease protein
MSRVRYFAVLSALAAALAAATVAGVALGAVPIPPKEALAAILSLADGGREEATSTIIVDLRLARSLLAACTGAALAVSGTAFQGFFRNPLADPFVIGASSGAAFGAALAIAFGLGDFGPISGPAAAAFLGALAAVAAAFWVSRLGGRTPPAAALLLAGTALSSLFSAALSLVIVVKDKELYRVYYWLLGGFAGSSWKELFSALPPMVLGCLMVWTAARPLDLLSFGEDAAAGMGLDVGKARLLVAAGASLAAASAVAAAGIIGFVGLVAPHVVRLLIGPSHRRLLPAAALAGALLVSLADTAARTAAPPIELPIGVITSLIGGPFFLYLIARKGRFLGGSK